MNILTVSPLLSPALSNLTPKTPYYIAFPFRKALQHPVVVVLFCGVWVVGRVVRLFVVVFVCGFFPDRNL